jgi:hypothetical protein
VVQNTVERNDEMECLEFILQKVIRFEDADGAVFERSIREMITMALSDEKFSPPLQRLGFLVKKDFLCIEKGHRSILDFLRGSKWSNNFGDQIARISGAVLDNPRFTAVGKRPRCVKIPMTQIFKNEQD